MSVDELAGLHLAQQLLGISAHIAGRYLVTHDLTLRIDDEGAALGKTVRCDQHFKVLGNAVGRVCQHRIADLPDPFGRIVPRFVDKMGIRGHGIDLAADGAELLILIRQILQLCGAYEGEIRGVEEENTPFPQDVLPADKLELLFVIGIGAEIGNFPVDHRHTCFLHKS